MPVARFRVTCVGVSLAAARATRSSREPWPSEKPSRTTFRDDTNWVDRRSRTVTNSMNTHSADDSEVSQQPVRHPREGGDPCARHTRSSGTRSTADRILVGSVDAEWMPHGLRRVWRAKAHKQARGSLAHGWPSARLRARGAQTNPPSEAVVKVPSSPRNAGIWTLFDGCWIHGSAAHVTGGNAVNPRLRNQYALDPIPDSRVRGNDVKGGSSSSFVSFATASFAGMTSSGRPVIGCWRIDQRSSGRNPSARPDRREGSQSRVERAWFRPPLRDRTRG